MQADAMFFGTLVQRLSVVLAPKGFRLIRNLYLRQSFGHRVATFEGTAFNVDAAWEGRDRDILLLRRDPQESNVSAGRQLADFHIPQGAAPEVYAQAIDIIVSAAASIEGAA